MVFHHVALLCHYVDSEKSHASRPPCLPVKCRNSMFLFSCNLISVIWSSEQWKNNEFERPEAGKRSNVAILWTSCFTHFDSKLKAVETSSGENVKRRNLRFPSTPTIFSKVLRGADIGQILAYLYLLLLPATFFFQVPFLLNRGNLSRWRMWFLWNFDAHVDPLLNHRYLTSKKQLWAILRLKQRALIKKENLLRTCCYKI